MDRNGVLRIVRGARDVARARGNSNVARKTLRQNIGCSGMRGQVGVAVRRDDRNSPFSAYDRRYVSDRDDEHEDETTASGEDPQEQPRPARTLQAGTQPPLDTTEHGAVDLTRDSPETTAGVADADGYYSSSDGGTRRAQSLGSWLQPAPPPKAGAAKGSSRRRKRPLKEAESSELPRGTRTWATASSQRTPGAWRAGGDGGLAAWLEPRQPASSRERRSTPSRSGTLGTAVGHGSSGHTDSSDDDDDSGRWMSDRLEGLDPSGAARAKDSWTVRERRNLTSTDVALGAKRKGRGGGRRGWKTKAGGSKVFAAPGRGGGAVVSSGQPASSRLFKGGDGDGRKKRKR